MKNVIASIVAAAGIATVATAQTSQLNMQVSLDGINWSSSVNAAPGSTVQLRGSMSFIQGAGTQTPTGFASLTWQPTVSNWTGSDTLQAFADRGNNTNGGSVLDTPGMPAPYGRISPFGSTGPTTSDPYRGHVQANGGVNYLRIARTVITNWVGEGATTGTAASNNFNGSGGLATVQKGAGNVNPTVDPPFNGNIANVVLFKAAITLSGDATGRILTVDAPTAGMSRNSSTGAREASWFSSSADNFGAIKAAVEVGTATIVVPAPGALALLGLGGLAIGRRRR